MRLAAAAALPALALSAAACGLFRVYHDRLRGEWFVEGELD